MQEGSRDRKLAFWVGALFCLVYAAFADGYFKGTDEVGVFEQSRAIAQGDLAVPPLLHTFPGQGGRRYSHFAVGQSVLALPFVGLGRLAESTLPARWLDALAGRSLSTGPHRFGGDVEIVAVGLYGPVASGALVALFFLFQRRLGASRRSALLAAALLGGTTYVAFLSGYFLRHTTEALCILGALYALYAFRQDGSARALAAGSLLASATLLVRVPAAIAGPALAGYAFWTLWDRARRGASLPGRGALAAALALPFAGVLGVHAALNQLKWGTWLGSPMTRQVAFLDGSLREGLAGFLWSPGSSLFVYSPLLLLAPLLFAGFWRQRRPESVAVLALAATFLLVCSSFRAWHGLWSAPGPRYLFVVTPLLLLPLGAWLDGERSRAGALALALLAALGAALQLLMLSVSWIDVDHVMGYAQLAPDAQSDYAFLFDPAQSPVVGYARVLGLGRIEIFVARVASGWEAGQGAPGFALALGLAWSLAAALCFWRLGRLVSAPAHPHGVAPGTSPGRPA